MLILLRHDARCVVLTAQRLNITGVYIYEVIITAVQIFTTAQKHHRPAAPAAFACCRLARCCSARARFTSSSASLFRCRCSASRAFCRLRLLCRLRQLLPTHPGTLNVRTQTFQKHRHSKHDVVAGPIATLSRRAAELRWPKVIAELCVPQAYPRQPSNLTHKNPSLHPHFHNRTPLAAGSAPGVADPLQICKLATASRILLLRRPSPIRWLRKMLTQGARNKSLQPSVAAVYSIAFSPENTQINCTDLLHHVLDSSETPAV